MSIISEACDKWFEAEEEAGHYPYGAAPSTVFEAGWHAALHETGLLEAAEKMESEVRNQLSRLRLEGCEDGPAYEHWQGIQAQLLAAIRKAKGG